MTDSRADGEGTSDKAGGPIRHVPVMLNEVVMALQPVKGETHIDGTFGAGGYTKAIVRSGADVIAIDRDPGAIKAGQDLVEKFAGKLKLVKGEFRNLDQHAVDIGVERVDGVVLDIGVSSMQLDGAERGFSFRSEGPLDMRMASKGISAADVVNFGEQSLLTRIFGILGEERHASRLSRAIVAARKTRKFETTTQLASQIEQVIGRNRPAKIHPATRAFQGLRIFVNGELEQLAYALFAAERILKPGGRLVVVSFHSLEDRIVKRFFQDRSQQKSGSRHMPQIAQTLPTFTQSKRSSVVAGEEEVHSNPRARSARLRFGVRSDVEQRDADLSIFKLPSLSTSQVNINA